MPCSPRASSNFWRCTYGIGCTRSASGEPNCPGGRQNALAFGKIAGVTEYQRSNGQTVRQGHDRGVRLRRVGKLRAELSVEAQHVTRFCHGMQYESAENRWADLVQLEFERCRHTEVAAAAAQAPEQVRVISVAGDDEFPIGADEVRRRSGCRMPSPCLPINQPRPPPRVKPETPVFDTVPPVVARPNACVSRSKSAHRAPACTCAVCARGSTRMPCMRVRSITSPSSHIASPAAL